MKKILSAFVLVAFSLLAVACSGQSESQTTDQQTNSGTTTAPSGADTPTLLSVRQIIKDLNLTKAKTDTIHAETLIADLGFDETEIGELAVNIETEFGVSIPMEQMTKFTTVGQLVTHIDQNVKQ
jgi:acyl carrier protein